jgi:hypothetical protein
VYLIVLFALLFITGGHPLGRKKGRLLLSGTPGATCMR